MRSFEINGIEYKIKTDWDELTVGDFIEIERHKQNKDVYEFEELWSIRLLELITTKENNPVENGELDNIRIGDLIEIMKEMTFLTQPFQSKLNRFVEIEGEKWCFVEKLEDLSAGEFISVKTIQENSSDNLDSLINSITILLRKCEEVDGEVVMEKFNPKKMEERKKIILKGSATKIIGYMDFFFSGKDSSSENDIKNYLMEEQNPKE